MTAVDSHSHLCYIFLTFVEKMFSISHEYIYFPRIPEELAQTMKHYEGVGVSGAIGSVDVVHVKRSNFPAGNFNWSKGKESYPSLAFECITDFNCHILGMFDPHFGSQNDEHIVKLDTTVQSLKGMVLGSVVEVLQQR